MRRPRGTEGPLRSVERSPRPGYGADCFSERRTRFFSYLCVAYRCQASARLRTSVRTQARGELPRLFEKDGVAQSYAKSHPRHSHSYDGLTIHFSATVGEKPEVEVGLV